MYYIFLSPCTIITYTLYVCIIVCATKPCHLHIRVCCTSLYSSLYVVSYLVELQHIHHTSVCKNFLSLEDVMHRGEEKVGAFPVSHIF